MKGLPCKNRVAVARSTLEACDSVDLPEVLCDKHRGRAAQLIKISEEVIVTSLGKEELNLTGRSDHCVSAIYLTMASRLFGGLHRQRNKAKDGGARTESAFRV